MGLSLVAEMDKEKIELILELKSLIANKRVVEYHSRVWRRVNNNIPQ